MKKKTLITDSGGLVWGNNNKGIVVVMDIGNWNFYKSIVVVHDSGI